MRDTRSRALEAFRRLADDVGGSYRAIAADVNGYRVAALSPGDVEYTDADWDGSDAEASYPNPSADDTDLDFLADHYLFAPTDLNEDDPPTKSAFKGPIRMGPGGPVNTNALLANIQAINGARGGFDGIDADTLRDGFEAAVAHLVAAGEYESEDDAPDVDVEAAATGGSVTADRAEGRVRFEADVTAATADDGSLTGIVWGEGDHDLALGGRPTPVHVPKETVRPTFEALREDVDAGDVTLGFDHPGPDSVAAKTGIVDIGVANDVGLTDDGSYIALTDSELTNDQAIEAKESGDFDDLDWSIVADVAVRRTDDGDVATTNDGRVILDATRIRRIDAVDDGAVDAASITRGTADLPDLRDEASKVAAAAENPKRRSDAVQALQATATALHENMGNTPFDPEFDDDLPDHVREQLNAAAEIIDDQEQELNAAKAKASGFEDVLSAHDVDPDDFDDPQAAAQAVIDEQTDDLRREIAELEAELPKFDTDDVKARASELTGSDPSNLRDTLNARKATAYDVQQNRNQKGRAAAKNDASGRVQPVGGTDAGGDADADELALQAMDGRDRIEAQSSGMSPSEYLNAEYGVHASNYEHADELHAEIMEQINEGDA